MPQNLKKSCFEDYLVASKQVFKFSLAFSEKLSFIYLQIFTNVAVSRICAVFIRPFCIIVDYSSTICIVIVRLIRILPVVKLDECSRGFIRKPCKKYHVKKNNFDRLKAENKSVFPCFFGGNSWIVRYFVKKILYFLNYYSPLNSFPFFPNVVKISKCI